MPKLAEIINLAGRTLREAEVKQAECLNMPSDEFRAALLGQCSERLR